MSSLSVAWLREHAEGIAHHDKDALKAVSSHMHDLVKDVYGDDPWKEYIGWFAHNLAEAYGYCLGMSQGKEDCNAGIILTLSCSLLGNENHLSLPESHMTWGSNKWPDWRRPSSDLGPILPPWKHGGADRVAMEDLFKSLLASYAARFEALFESKDAPDVVRGVFACMNSAAQLVEFISGLWLLTVDAKDKGASPDTPV